MCTVLCSPSHRVVVGWKKFGGGVVECAAGGTRLSRARMGSWTGGWWSTLLVGDVSSTWSPPEGRGFMSGMGVKRYRLGSHVRFSFPPDYVRNGSTYNWLGKSAHYHRAAIRSRIRKSSEVSCSFAISLFPVLDSPLWDMLRHRLRPIRGARHPVLWQRPPLQGTSHCVPQDVPPVGQVYRLLGCYS